MARYLLKRKFLENETDNSPLEYKNTTFYLKVNLRKRSSSLLTSLNSKASEVNLTKDINEEVWKWNSGTSGDNTNSALLIGHYPDESYAASVAYFVVPILILISLFAITMMVRKTASASAFQMRTYFLLILICKVF